MKDGLKQKVPVHRNHHGVGISLNSTTCSEGAWRRGRGQKVIGFTLFEDTEDSPKRKENREYFKGIVENLELMKKYYPGWVMRLYYDTGTLIQEKLCDLACSQPLIDLCPAKAVPKLGNATRLYPLLWRFLPAIDPQVDLFLSRDLDSRISPREVSAVTEFLKSEAKVHVMRDHPAHGAVMMGGMWGAKVWTTRLRFRKAFTELFKNGLAYMSRLKGGWDQVALQRYVWPWAKKMLFSHDSYTCKRFSYTHPFPTRREEGIGNYVGSVVSLGATITSDCPFKCRPQEHKDWLTC